MVRKETILERWQTSAEELTDLIDSNPSLRGMLLGYIAELKLRQLWFAGRIQYEAKHDDHDRKKKGDHIIRYAGEQFIVECKSLQTNSIKRDGDKWVAQA